MELENENVDFNFKTPEAFGFKLKITYLIYW